MANGGWQGEAPKGKGGYKGRGGKGGCQPWGGQMHPRPAVWPQAMPGGPMPMQQQRQAPASSLLPEQFLGNWADSLGNSVVVFSMCAYEVALMATLSQPPRKDINLRISQLPDGVW